MINSNTERLKKCCSRRVFPTADWMVVLSINQSLFDTRSADVPEQNHSEKCRVCVGALRRLPGEPPPEGTVRRAGEERPRRWPA